MRKANANEHDTAGWSRTVTKSGPQFASPIVISKAENDTDQHDTLCSSLLHKRPTRDPTQVSLLLTSAWPHRADLALQHRRFLTRGAGGPSRCPPQIAVHRASALPLGEPP